MTSASETTAAVRSPDDERGGAAPPRSLAFVSSLFAWGGGEKWMLDAAVAMRDRGHGVILVALAGSALARRGQAASLAVVPVRPAGWLEPRPLWDLAGVLRRERVRTVCVNLDKEIRQCALAGLGRGLKLVARRGSPDRIKDNWHYRLVYTRAVDRLICNCEALAATICDPVPWFDRTRLRVIPNGVDVEVLAAAAAAGGGRDGVRRALGLTDHHFVVACIGEVGWRKGQEIFLTTAARLRAAHPEAVFLIAGEGSGRDDLERRAHREGLLDVVRFLGFRDDVPALLAASDILVLPSRSEGFPNTLLEGMALGVPVVATRADGIPELVVDGVTGALVDVDDEPRFTAEVARLLDDPALRRRRGEAGRARVRRDFSQSRAMDAVEDCLCRW
jgi:glycosyltransferase involved in cell wall biosynthesis